MSDDRARFLSRTGLPPYTRDPTRKLRGEAEPVGDDWLKRFSADAHREDAERLRAHEQILREEWLSARAQIYGAITTFRARNERIGPLRDSLRAVERGCRAVDRRLGLTP